MKCPSCQAENREDSRFCHQCATPLPKDTQPPVAPTKTMLTLFEDLSRGMLFAGRYEVIEELGKGGRGRVYRVYDQKINEVVALKLIKPEIGFNEKAVERFKNELKIARKISHRNVCRLYDLGEYVLAHFMEAEDVTGSGVMLGTPPNDTLGKIGSVLSRFIPSGEQLDVQASEKFMESIKGIIPEKGPYQEAYNKAAELFRQRKKRSDTGNAEGAKQTGKEAQGEMQKLLSLVSERRAAQKTKEIMAVAKTQAGRTSGRPFSTRKFSSRLLAPPNDTEGDAL